MPYSLLVREDAGQRQYPLRESFNTLRYVVSTGCTWRYLPHDYERLAVSLQQLPYLAFVGIMLAKASSIRGC